MSTVVGREKLDHPSLGASGGSALHLAIETIYTNLGNDNPGRFKAFSAIANSAVTTIDHNFGVALSELNVYLYTGSHPTLTRVANPTAAGWAIAPTSGSETTQIDVTAPSSGGPHTFVVFVVHGSSNLDLLTDVDLSVAPEDGQALVYEALTGQWKPGASGDASFKIQSVSTPNAVIKGGYLLLDDGRELASYDGAGSASTDFGKDLTVSLSTILGGAPANATAYYLYLDLTSLGASVTQSDTGRVVYPITISNFVLSTVSPEFTDNSRYVARAVIKSATTGTAWSGSGAGFATLAFLAAQTVDAKLKSSMILNYIDTSTPEKGVGAAITYADSAGAVPVDGVGGSPNVTFTRNTTSPIRGVADFKFSKDAANRQGQGFSIPFTIPTTDKGIKARMKFRYNSTSTNYAAGDMVMYVYDVTNSLLLTPVVTALPKHTSIFETTFDLTTGTSYRLIGHVATTNASAYDVHFDDFRVDIERQGVAASISGPQFWTPTFTAFGTVTNIALSWVKVGTRLKATGTFKAGTPTASTAKLSLPSGLTVNPAYHINNKNDIGRAILTAGAVQSVFSNGNEAVVMADSSDPGAVFFSIETRDSASNNVMVPQAGNSIFNANGNVSIWFEVEIAQFAGAAVDLLSESVVQSNVRVQATGTSIGSTASGVEVTAVYPTEEKDTHNAYDSSTGIFTAPVAGDYHVDARFTWDGPSTNYIWLTIRKNSTAVKTVEFNGGNYSAISGVVSCAKGDTISIRTFYSSGTSPRNPVNTVSTQTLDIFRIADYSAGDAVGFGQLTGTNSGLMPAVLANLDDVAATRMGLKSYSHGTTYNGGNAPTVTLVGGGGTLTAVQKAMFMPYQLQSGDWRCRFNITIEVSSTSRTFIQLSINGMTFSNIGGAGPGQAISGGSNAAGAFDRYSAAQRNASTVIFAHDSVVTDEYMFSGDVELASKPTWAY
jgi:hypothetical protein